MNSLTNSPKLSISFQNRRERLTFKKPLPLPVLSLKSRTEPFEQQVEQKRPIFKVFNPHFTLKKMRQILNSPIQKRSETLENQNEKIKQERKVLIRQKIGTNWELHYRRASNSILKTRVLERIRTVEEKKMCFGKGYKIDIPQKYNKKKVNTKKEAIKPSSTERKQKILKCLSLSSEISPRKIHRRLSTIQVKYPIRFGFCGKEQNNDICGWQNKIKKFQKYYDPTNQIDIYSDHYF